MRRATLLIVALLLCSGLSREARADIFQWEDVDPGDPSQGRQPSSVLCPGGAGLVPGPGMNAAGRNLSRGYLSGYDLTDSSFFNATLASADLSHANLTCANLSGASLSGAILARAELVDADLSGSDLGGATFGDAILTGADLSGANIAHAAFFGATLTSANLKGASLSGDYIYFSSLNDANMSGAKLTGAYVVSSTFNGTSLCGAKLTGVRFSGSTLTGADLSGADARGALGMDASAAITRNFIHAVGHVERLSIAAGETMRLWDFDPAMVPYNSSTPVGDIPILVQDSMSVDPMGTLRVVFEDDQWGSTIKFDEGISVTLGGTLELLFASDVDATSLVGATFDLFDWTGVTPTGTFDTIAFQDGMVWGTTNLYTTGEVTLQAVPEPSTWAMLAVAAGSLLMFVRRRRG